MRTPEEQASAERGAKVISWFMQAVLFTVASTLMIGYTLRDTGLMPDADWKVGFTILTTLIIVVHTIRWFGGDSGRQND